MRKTFFHCIQVLKHVERMEKTFRTKKTPTLSESLHINFTFSRESESHAARVLFNSLYMLARSCSALFYVKQLLKIGFEFEGKFSILFTRKFEVEIYEFFEKWIEWIKKLWMNQSFLI